MGGKAKKKSKAQLQAELRKLKEQEDQEAIARCEERIRQVCDEEGCILLAVLQVRGQQMGSYVEIARKSEGAR